MSTTSNDELQTSNSGIRAQMCQNAPSNSKSAKTNPRPHSAPLTAAAHAAALALNATLASFAHQDVPQRAQLCQSAPSKSAQIEKSNPPPSPSGDWQLKTGNSSLTERQLAALRLLLAGRPIGQVAASLNINRHTLTRWRRQPQFIQEFQKLHTHLALHRAPHPSSIFRPPSFPPQPPSSPAPSSHVITYSRHHSASSDKELA